MATRKKASSSRDTRGRDGDRVRTVGEIMTTNPIVLPPTASMMEAARLMRDDHIGDVIVAEGDHAAGILTDRDIVVRGVASGCDPLNTAVVELCSRDLATVSSADAVDTAIRLMSEHAVRRLPVVENDRVVGIVSIGDLAQARDRHSALGTLSAAPPSR